MTGIFAFILFIILGVVVSPWWFVGNAVLLVVWFIDDQWERKAHKWRIP